MACRKVDRAIARKIIDSIDNFLFDCDGVLWEASKEIPGSADTVAALRKLGKKIFYITNNSGKTRSQYVQKCKSLGFHAAEEDVICTGHAAAQYIKAQNLQGKVYCVGNASMGVELDSFGIKHFGIGPDEVPGTFEQIGIPQHITLDPEVSCVLVGFDPHINYMKMTKAASYIRKNGTLFVATNEDTHLPLAGDLVVPGTGAVVGAIKIPARKEPVVVGKPNSVMFDLLKKEHNLDPARCMMVGDSCHTDIYVAQKCGMSSLLVLTGVSSLEDVQRYKDQSDPDSKFNIPNFYCTDLNEFGQLI
ncbi:glycerol-3-phosphate phosphatase-like isoform X2 [Mytilus californianus]|uniref:glycerol-3-phosphate phosphatase-like isoform X2 n=1 Tax=Mytilus californianus TaxID=6549 RepID=UPI002248647B|nr:glycerol-3-phosphate phosphatase-like isoform X2 [Mytilus californianus]